MTTLGPCVYCGAVLESTVAHVCPDHLGGSPSKTFWADRDPEPARATYYTLGSTEAIDIAEHLPFCLGNVVKYVVRAGRKEGADEIHDLRKADWYLRREIERRTK